MNNKCVKCGSSPCYISLLGDCECSNKTCTLYSKELYGQPEPVTNKTILTEKEQNKDDDADYSMTYSWVTHHHDFGDI
jgi:hypothetical protein